MPTKKYNPDEPGRQWPHRQMLERLHGQDNQITALLGMVRVLQRRVAKLEAQQCGYQSHTTSRPPGMPSADGVMST